MLEWGVEWEWSKKVEGEREYHKHSKVEEQEENKVVVE
jgi:hypothetical protein